MKSEASASRRRWMRFRLCALGVVLTLGATVLVYRAYVLQRVRAPALGEMAEAQYLKRLKLSPKRGTIRDRHGVELAVSVEIDSVWANPRELKRRGASITEVAQALQSVLGLPRAQLLDRLGRDKLFVWLKRHVQPKQAEALRQLSLPGIYLSGEARRFYPHKSLASHVLGFANIDGVGQEGLERSFEDTLRGSTESAPAVRDRDGRIVFSERLLDDRAAQGDDLVLSLDRAIQHRAELELARAVAASEARSGSLVAVDPMSGEILALANVPTFNPNEPGAAPPGARRNRAVADRFEPGSTLKPFTVAAALAAGVLKPNALINCEGGRMAVADKFISDTHAHDLLRPAEVLAYSSNIGTAKIGRMLGDERLYWALKRFGFGTRTGVELPAESSGALRHHAKWFELDAATIAFGQGMSLTALQLALAISTLANGGNLMEPRLVRAVIRADGRTEQAFAPKVRRRVLPRRVARMVAEMLAAVTGASGTGTEASLEHHLAAGKTGTAQKARKHGRGYEKDKWVASFVGFAPLEAPRLAVAVVIDEPVAAHAGGVVAAPVFRRVADASLRRLGVPAQGSQSLLARLRKQQAPARTPVPNRSPAPRAEPVPEGGVAVPSLIGLGARTALKRLAKLKLLPQLEGYGQVVAQEPGPGAVLVPGAPVRMMLEPQARVAAVNGIRKAETAGAP